MLLAAVRMRDRNTEAAAKQQLMKMRAAMVGLLGEARATSTLDEVEVAVKVTMEGAFKQEDEAAKVREEQAEKNRENQRLRVEKQKEEAKVKAEQQAKQTEFVGKFLTNMSVTNERLCHEIILDPTYKIPGSSQEEEEGKGVGLVQVEPNPVLDHAKKIQEQMKRVFWDGLVVSLTPPAQSSSDDFVASATVQVKYGPNGAYYSGKIIDVNNEGSDDEVDEDGDGEERRKKSYDVLFTGDSVVQKRLPVEVRMGKSRSDELRKCVFCYF